MLGLCQEILYVYQLFDSPITCFYESLRVRKVARLCLVRHTVPNFFNPLPINIIQLHLVVELGPAVDMIEVFVNRLGVDHLG